MIIKQLGSNIPTFHTIEFKKGLNFIIGKKSVNSNNPKDSYNGVGKSLIIELIHFCLGSKKIKEFNKLGNFYCELIIEDSGIEYIIQREFNDGQKIFLNGKEKKLKDFKLFLEEICFKNLEQDNSIHFRSLISRFIRRYKNSYSSCLSYIKEEQKQISLLNTGYLLGIDYKNIKNKIDNKEKYTLLKSTEKSLKEDKVLVEYFKGNGSIDYKINDIEDKLKKLEEKRDSFQVAENYKELKSEADSISVQCRTLSNEIVILERKIQRIEKCLKEKINPNYDDIKTLYEQININLPEQLIKTIDEVCLFHKTLINNRYSSFEKQKKEYVNKIEKINEELSELNKLLTEKMEILSKSGALEDYNIILNEINETNILLQKFKDYKKLMDKYSVEIEKSKKKKAEINIENKEYLESIDSLLKKLNDTFRLYSRQFYNDKPSGLTIKLNTKDNKLAFDIDADIEGDSSDGINEVKIFCFDLTLLSNCKKNVEFLFHDSRLFSNMDPRQRVIWFNIIDEFFKDNDYQYIASINEDVVDTMLNEVILERQIEIQKIINENTRIELTDESPNSKLLGYNINIKYDKD